PLLRPPPPPPPALFPYTTLFRSPSTRSSTSTSARRTWPRPRTSSASARSSTGSLRGARRAQAGRLATRDGERLRHAFGRGDLQRSEEHTSELQSRGHLVCRLLLE